MALDDELLSLVRIGVNMLTGVYASLQPPDLQALFTLTAEEQDALTNNATACLVNLPLSAIETASKLAAPLALISTAWMIYYPRISMAQEYARANAASFVTPGPSPQPAPPEGFGGVATGNNGSGTSAAAGSSAHPFARLFG